MEISNISHNHKFYIMGVRLYWLLEHEVGISIGHFKREYHLRCCQRYHISFWKYKFSGREYIIFRCDNEKLRTSRSFTLYFTDNCNCSFNYSKEYYVVQKDQRLLCHPIFISNVISVCVVFFY